VKELAVQLAVVRELEARLKEAKTALNEQLLAGLDEGDRKSAALEDGTKLGSVTKVAARKTPTVVDEGALARWVKKNRPDEIVETVRISYRNVLLGSAKTHGEAVDESTGEIVPGIEMREGNPYISYRAAEGAGAVIASRWQELIGGVLEIEGGAA